MKLGKHNFGKELLKKVGADVAKGSGEQSQKDTFAVLNKELETATQTQEVEVKGDVKVKKVDWGSLFKKKE